MRVPDYPSVLAVLSGTSATVESNGTVTITGPGATTIRASQDGNGSYNPAPTVGKDFGPFPKLPKRLPSVALSDASLQAGTYSPSVARASSGLSVSFISSDSTVAELSGSTLTPEKRWIDYHNRSSTGWKFCLPACYKCHTTLDRN